MLNAFRSPRPNAHYGRSSHCDRSRKRRALHVVTSTFSNSGSDAECSFVAWHVLLLLGLVGTQGPVSSVLIQKHSSEQAISGAPPSRHPYGQRAPPTRTTNTKTSRGPTVQTIHTTPVKVVHWLPSIICYPSFSRSQFLLVIANDSIF